MSAHTKSAGQADSPQIQSSREHDSAGQSLTPNVGDSERLVSGIAGCGLIVYGLSRPGLRIIPMVLGGALIYRAATGWCSMYQALGLTTAARSEQASIGSGEGVHIQKTVMVNGKAEDLYRRWRKLDNLPRILSHVESVVETDAKHSHWVVTGPLGVTFEWDAEIIRDVPGELIAWKSLEDADVASAGSVHFRQHGESETEVDLNLRYSPPAGQISETVAGWFGSSPQQQIERDLADFKTHLEFQSPA